MRDSETDSFEEQIHNIDTMDFAKWTIGGAGVMVAIGFVIALMPLSVVVPALLSIFVLIVVGVISR